MHNAYTHTSLLRANSKKGFTLVELSIVLVIIGLLIGGILVAQSLVDSAKINGFVSDIQQYDAAVVNFKLRYRNLPGDSNKLNGIGDNDGFIENVPGVYNSMNIATADVYGNATGSFTGETANFWADLVVSGLNIRGMETPNTNAASGVFHNEHVPETRFGDTGIIGGSVYDMFPETRVNAYIISDTSATTSSTYAYSSFDSAGTLIVDAVAIDRKIDDNSATTGNVMSGYYILDDNDCSAEKVATFGDYRLCYMFIKMPVMLEY